MSKIYDVEKMYGQDFSIVTTNAPSNIIKQAKKLLPNTFLISSPQDGEEDRDNNMPAMFVTDYNAQPLQLTYPFYMKNGLNYSNEYGYAFINIDHSTIVTENNDGTGELKVNTENLSNASFSNKGVVKLSNEIKDYNRNLGNEYANLQESIAAKYNNSTFITINDDGILYLNNDFLGLINSIVDLKIKQKLDSIKVMLNNNLKMWILIKMINGIDRSYLTETHTIGGYDSIDLDNDSYTSITFDLYYYSFNNESETIEIKDETNVVYSISQADDNWQTIVSEIPDNDEIYQHTINDITLIFLPNYFIENNESYNKEYSIIFNIDNDKSEALTFKQNKLDNYDKNHLDITLDSDKLYINDIKNISVASSIKENIINQVLVPIKLDGTDLVKFSKRAFIVNNNDENNNYILFDNVNYDTVNNDIYISNQNEDGSPSLLYTFIDTIINKSSENSDSDKYDLYFGETVKISDTESIVVNDYVFRELSGETINYFINVCTELSINNINNIEMGKYSVTFPIQLILDKKTIYGYILIKQNNTTLTNTVNNSNVATHLYYNNRSVSGRKYLNDQSGDYNANDIETNKLYCIFSNDLLYTDESHNNATFRIYYDSIKQQDNDTINNINSVNINSKFSIHTDQNNYLEYDINNSIDDLNNLLVNSLPITIKYNNSNSDTTIQSQTVLLNVNLLELMMNNITFTYDNGSKKLYNETINLLNNKSTASYYEMQNYVIKNTVNNNTIKSISIKIPQYVIYALSNSTIQFTVTFGFYYQNTLEEVIFSVFKSQEKLNGTLNKSNILALEDSQVSIDYTNADETKNKFVLKQKDNGMLPKLLLMRFNFSFNDLNNYKACYIRDSKSCSGGELHSNENETIFFNKDLNTNLVDIVYSTIVQAYADNEGNEGNEFIRQLISTQSSNPKIYIDNLVLTNEIQYVFTNITTNDYQSLSPSNYGLLLNNNKSYDKAEHGTKHIIKYYYKYLDNSNRSLDTYNKYSGTPINGEYSTDTYAQYQLRFTNIYLQYKWQSNPSSSLIVNNYSNLNLIEIFNNDSSAENGINYVIERVLIGQGIFDIFLNNTNITSIIKQFIKFKDISGNTVQTLSYPNEYKIYLSNNYSPYLDNAIYINDLYLGYNIKYTTIKWGGLTLPNKELYGRTIQIDIIHSGDSGVDNHSISSNIESKVITLDQNEQINLSVGNISGNDSNSDKNTIYVKYVKNGINVKKALKEFIYECENTTTNEGYIINEDDNVQLVINGFTINNTEIAAELPLNSTLLIYYSSTSKTDLGNDFNFSPQQITINPDNLTATVSFKTIVNNNISMKIYKNNSEIYSIPSWISGLPDVANITPQTYTININNDHQLTQSDNGSYEIRMFYNGDSQYLSKITSLYINVNMWEVTQTFNNDDFVWKALINGTLTEIQSFNWTSGTTDMPSLTISSNNNTVNANIDYLIDNSLIDKITITENRITCIDGINLDDYANISGFITATISKTGFASITRQLQFNIKML